MPNITFGPAIVDAIRKETKLPLDVHLMVKHPERHVQRFINAGGDIITVHIEACNGNTTSLIDEIHNRGKKVGVAIKLNTPLSKIAHALKSVDIVLLMSVEPGFAGQTFDKRVLHRIEALKKMRCEKGYNFEIEVDGGIRTQIASLVAQAGATVLVVGSALFGQTDVKKAIQGFREESC